MAWRNSFLWQTFLLYMAIILLSLIFITVYMTRAFETFYYQDTASVLQARSILVGKLIRDSLVRDEPPAVQSVCSELGKTLSTRITVMYPSGKVIGDSEENPENMENHAGRSEMKEAIAGRAGVSRRYSNTLRQKMIYVAVPVQAPEGVIGVVRCSLSVAALSKTLKSLYKRILAVGFFIILLAAIITWLVSRHIQKPVEELRRGAVYFGEGKLEHRLHITKPKELNMLAVAMNAMAGQLQKRLNTIISQRNELQGILAGMVSGVLVIDSEERIVRINESAAKMFESDPEAAVGRTVQEVIRHIDVLRFVRDTLSGNGSREMEIHFYTKPEKHLQIHGTLLCDESGRRTGAVLVLMDITRLKKLENVRKDFVSNVTHELKTPITAIKGSVETLKEGAINDPKDAGRFLDILSKHTDRLDMIIQDLLNLSRIELESEKKEILFHKESICKVLKEAVSEYESRAAEKGVRLELQCEKTLEAVINASLLEKAVVNLIDNAIKYSPRRSTIRIEGTREAGVIAVRIQDHGSGIPKEHHERIFERFYRVDKARSRNMGGTGLGLAIVKHIAQAHGGRVVLDSRPGEGSTFTIFLPIAS
jgi:two-component system phosphate regulon sensor histidine kinase PhoR